MNTGNQTMKKCVANGWRWLVIGLLGQLIWITAAMASASLDDITFAAKTGDQVEITLHMSGDVPKPGSFTIDNPARLALDLPDTQRARVHLWLPGRVRYGPEDAVAAVTCPFCLIMPDEPVTGLSFRDCLPRI